MNLEFPHFCTCDKKSRRLKHGELEQKSTDMAPLSATSLNAIVFESQKQNRAVRTIGTPPHGNNMSLHLRGPSNSPLDMAMY